MKIYNIFLKNQVCFQGLVKKKLQRKLFKYDVL